LYYNRGMGVNVIVALWRALRTFLETLWRVTRQLFHEAAGTAFLLLALGGALSTWRYWKSRPAIPPVGSEFWAVSLAAMFTLMMAAFSVASFRSARRVR
jgi:glycerol uptake facilitator-like aquaporin